MNQSTDPAVTDPATDPPPSSDGATQLLRGLDPGFRYRCGGCGNVTRFDVELTTRSRCFHHFDLGGTGTIEEEEVLARELGSVTCRWCGRDDQVRVEPAPGTAPA